MGEKPGEGRSLQIPHWGWGMLALLIVAYPLSMGPSWWVVMTIHENWAVAAYKVLYAPALFVHDAIGAPETFEDFVHWWAP